MSKITTPGSKSTTVPEKYKFQEFPKVVYGESLEDKTTISSEDERPDGYLDYEDAIKKFQTPEEKKAATAKKKKSDAAAKAKKAKEADEALRVEIFAYLDEHGVDYSKDISTDDLESLKVKLDEHLGQQDPKDDSDK